MKHPLLVLLLGTVGPVMAGPVMRDAATHESLVPTYRKAQQEDPMRNQPPAKGKAEDPSVVNRPKSLIEQSDIICYNGCVALIPKRAILTIPKNVADRFTYKPGCKLMNWPEFYALNRGWITTIEVSRDQAEGKAPLADTTRKQIETCGNLVIAVYKAGPISLLPAKEASTVPQS